MSETNPSQAMRPHGIVGRLFACLMENMNEKAYRWTIDHLRDRRPERFYEIGFGTGRLLELAADTLGTRRLRGVDPSKLMVETATNRLRKFKRKADIDLRVGDDTSSFWGGEKFDAVAALHSFQFWADAPATLGRVREQLSPGGSLVIVLRRHGKNPPSWLPNPISRSRDEIASTKAALAVAHFAVNLETAIDRTSYGIVVAPC
jgi:SAM-dependent methyltransferase